MSKEQASEGGRKKKIGEGEERKKWDLSLSGERFNEDDLIRSAAEFIWASKRILTSIAGSESSGENCRQLFPKSRADALALTLASVLLAREWRLRRRRAPHAFVRACTQTTHTRTLLRKGQRRSSCVNHSAKLQQLRETGRKSAHTIRVRSHFVVSHALFHSRFAQILNGYRDRTAFSILRSFFLSIRARFDSTVLFY